LLGKFGEVDVERFGHVDKTDQFRVRERRLGLSVDVRGIVGLGIDLEVARELLLLLFALEPRLGNDALSGRRQGSPKSSVGFGSDEPVKPGNAAMRCQIASLVTLTTATSGAP
jgi:hypothetical protein